jgi:hypothetical protein
MVYSYKGLMRVNMNYYIEKHDMEIILDALECLSEHIKTNNNSPYPWTVEDVDGLFQSFDNGHKEDCK